MSYVRGRFFVNFKEFVTRWLLARVWHSCKMQEHSMWLKKLWSLIPAPTTNSGVGMTKPQNRISGSSF